MSSNQLLPNNRHARGWPMPAGPRPCLTMEVILNGDRSYSIELDFCCPAYVMAGAARRLLEGIAETCAGEGARQTARVAISALDDLFPPPRRQALN
jgi:hypothetical protein